MHLLSSRHHDEFLAVPQLARFTMAKGAKGAKGAEPTLLLKVTTLTAKYLLRLKRLKLVLMRSDGYLVYGIAIDDGDEYPAIVWSYMETADELQVMNALMRNASCVLFVFNELAVNVAWSELAVDLSPSMIRDLIIDSPLRTPMDGESDNAIVDEGLDHLLRSRECDEKGCMIALPEIESWKPVESHYITNGRKASLLNLFSVDEGGQQEELILWLIDALKIEGAYKNPKVLEPGRMREFSDLVLFYERGCFIIESKSLSILERAELPNRKRLAKSLEKHAEKALRQLVGAVKSIQRGFPVSDSTGSPIPITLDQPPHLIVLVPDLSLLAESTLLSRGILKEAARDSGGFIHILDPIELLRVVQAANMIAAKGKATTPIEAFDYYLIERMKYLITSKSLDLNVLLRFS